MQARIIGQGYRQGSLIVELDCHAVVHIFDDVRMNDDAPIPVEFRKEIVHAHTNARKIDTFNSALGHLGNAP